MELIVKRKQFTECKVVPCVLNLQIPLKEGQVLVEIVKFALTSNNLSYAQPAGEKLGYFDFFLCDHHNNSNNNSEREWGYPIAWGYGKVVVSKNALIQVGETIFGCYPMSSFVVLKPIKVTQVAFTDGTSHRSQFAPAYSGYKRVDHDASFYNKKIEDVVMLYYMIFLTSWLACNYSIEKQMFHSSTVIITSASSKTSYGLAYEYSKQLNKSQREQLCVIGLTSSGNMEFVRNLRLYDKVVSYDDIETIPNQENAFIVDMLGKAEVNAKLHQHLKTKLQQHVAIGQTHWEDSLYDLGDPRFVIRPKFFFAPGEVLRLVKESGDYATVNNTMNAAWMEFAAFVKENDVCSTRRTNGGAAVQQLWCDMLKKVDPRDANVVSFHASAESKL